jgi:FAD synthase
MCYCLYQHPSFPIVVVCAFYESVCSLKQNASQHVKRLIVGNKSDFEAGRKVSTKQGRQLATEYGLEFMEVSAFKNTNVSEVSALLLSKTS